jgi:hypothetical protein
MNFDDFLHAIVDTLEALGVTYMLGGSVASSFYGEPRSTRDVDVALLLPLEKANHFVQAFQNLGYHVYLDAVIDAAMHGLPFNVIDAESGYKADFFLIGVEEPTPLEQSALSRRQRAVYDEERGAQASLYSPEDVIIYKLKYFLSGRSDKHLRDISAMLVVQGEALDYAYIENWAAEIGATDVWRHLLAEYRRRMRS